MSEHLASSPSAISPWALYRPAQRWGFLVVLTLIATSNLFDYFILSVVLEPIKQEFHVSDTMLGLLSGFVFAAIYAIAGLPIARWADRGNRRTIISVALAGWSVMTVVCGLAQSFWQLAAARFGLGVVQPGAMPTAQSLVADYFPPQRRATAIAILNSGTALGWLVGVGLGGYIAANWGWRNAFIWAGIPGLALAALAWLILPEPRCRLGFPSTELRAESIAETLRRLRGKRSYVWALAGVTMYTVFAYGVNTFLPSFMIRTFHATLEQVSISWGVAAAAATLVGAVAGGSLADRLSRRDVRWYAWLPALACGTGAGLYGIALNRDGLRSFITVASLAELVLAMGIPVYFAALHAVCGNSRRAMAVAISIFSTGLVGGGFGPLIVGALSDAFNARYGLESLRYALIAMLAFLLPAVTAFYWSARAMLRDVEA